VAWEVGHCLDDTDPRPGGIGLPCRACRNDGPPWLVRRAYLVPDGSPMHFRSLLVLSALLGQGLVAQNILTGIAHTGSVTTSTQSVDYVYTRGGSPRTGYYYYWRETVEQSTQAGNAIPLNGSSDLQSAAGTFFSPMYGALAIGFDSLVNTPTHATYDLLLATETVFQPLLAAHQGATVHGDARDSFTFTLATASHVSFNVAGTATNAQLIDVAANEAIWSGTGPHADTLDAGTYRISVIVTEAAAANTQTNTASNPGTNLAWTLVHLDVTPGQ
jgi:hypothetical protein